jgi:Undecaprenyl-phosphate glucose phosphotransferase
MHEKKTSLALYYLVLDLFILNLSFVLTLYIDWPWETPSILGLAVILPENLSWIITFFVISKKNLYLRDGFSNRAWRISLRTVVYVFISIVVFQLFTGSALKERFWLFGAVLLFYILRLGVYFTIYHFLRDYRSKGVFTKMACIVGQDTTAKILAAALQNNKVLGYDFAGFVSSNKTPYDLGHIANLSAIVDRHQIKVIFVVVSLHKANADLKALITLAIQKGIRIKLVPVVEPLLDWSTKSEKRIAGIAIIDPFDFPLDSHANRLLKRGFDVVFSSLVIVLLFSWLFPILAVLIKLGSKGPVFFVQKRTGINNKTFRCLKFRSMRSSADADSKQSDASDQRITAVGRFLRKTNLDEFPQFFNVWWGQMSVVGPRPHMLVHTDFYKDLVPFYQSRHFIKPGVTGWAQINGYRGVTDALWKMEKRVEYDLYYIRNQSFYLDLKIIISTVFDRKSYQNAG